MARRHTPVIVTALLAVAAAGAATAEAVSVYFPAQVAFTAKAHFGPKKLPSNKRVGGSFRIDDKIGMADGSHPPALQEFVLQLDRAVALDAKGLPVCRPRPSLEQEEVAGAESIAGHRRGEGKLEFDVAFPESSPFLVTSKMVAFNGGTAGGKTKIFIHAFLATPVSAAVVITVEVRKVRKGRYGLEAVAKVPKIAGGYGSITSFSLKLGREFTYKGSRRSFLSLECADGQLQAKETAMFSDGSAMSGTTIRPCVSER